MALKHDAQGFLTGDPIDIGRALKVWDDILQPEMGAVDALHGVVGIYRHPAPSRSMVMASKSSSDSL